jgi:hypothetical protein
VGYYQISTKSNPLNNLATQTVYGRIFSQHQNTVMKLFTCSALVLSLLGLASCSKNSVSNNTESTQTTPTMGFKTLNNLEINSASKPVLLDVNDDGDYDLSFEIKRDNEDLKLIRQARFQVKSSFYSSLPLNTNGEVEPMIQSTYIPTENFKGNTWQKEKTATLLEKNIAESGTIRWSGNWANVGKKYLAFQLLKNNDRFSGWIELTEDVFQNKIILHKAAYSKVSGKTIKAGFDY